MRLKATACAKSHPAFKVSPWATKSIEDRKVFDYIVHMIKINRLFNTFLVAALLVATAVLLSSCGGGGGTATASEPLTKAQFIKRASAICQKEDPEKFRRLRTAVDPDKGIFGSSPRELEKLAVKVGLPLYKELIEEFESLKAPAKDAARIDSFLRILNGALKDAETNPHQLLSKDPFAPANEVAAKYGIEGCSL